MARKTLSSVVCAFVSVAAAQPSMAKPKGGGGGSGCTCICTTPGGLDSTGVYDSRGYSCAVFEGKTCNIVDPVTGGIRSGTIQACAPTSSGLTRVPSPFGGSAIYRGPRPAIQ